MPILLAMKGHPATGKSTLARALARAQKWPLLDKDDIKDQTLGLPNANDLAYAILWQMVRTQLQLGLSVVVDSPFAYPWLYEQAVQMVREQQARLLVVETTLDEQHWRQRLDARPAAESAHKIRGWDQMQAQLLRYDGCWRYPIGPDHHQLVDTAAPVDQMVQIVQARLARPELI